LEQFRSAFKSSFSAALVADAAYRVGAPVGVPASNILPLERDTKIAGPAVTVETNNDLVAALVALNRAEKGSVLVIGNAVNGPAGLTGDIIATEASRGGLEAIVVDGCVRDVAEIRRIGLPVFSRGRIPVGPLKLSKDQKGIGVPGAVVQFGKATIRPGQWIVGDDDGLIVLNEEDLPAILEQAMQSFKKEEALVAQIRDGAPLGDLFGIEEFFERRKEDPDVDFNEHVASKGKAI